MKSLRRHFRGRRCERRGHDWLMAHGYGSSTISEFIPIPDICLHCGAKTTTLPWGQCLNGHPLAEHYTPEGGLTEHPTCPQPR